MTYSDSVSLFALLRRSKGITLLLKIFLLIFLFSCSQSDKKTQDIVTADQQQSEEKKGDATATIRTLPDFKVELLYEVPRKSQGTWVSLAIDKSGRMVASDEYQQGMYSIHVQENTEGKPIVQVTKLVLPATGAQGLAWFNNRLYANVNGSGLFRMSASTPDGILDEIKFLGGPQSSSDHGNHALVPIPDGSGLYVVNGNHTPLPAKYSSHVLNWKEDILLTRQWDARGHAMGILAPGGYIAKIDPDARNWDILSVGYRNTYDVAIHPNGEMFTFDSDMEWDMGMPWYRPTRILHVVSGSDYGWRSGSGKWKAFYEDSHPSVVDVGPASPTGVLFGTGARFPEKYQKALFALDWTYGTIYAFHLEPKGASYTATAEEFLSGQPLAVTDAVIGKDGAMYFITGGWNNDTKLYRVTYTGSASTEPLQFRDDPAGQASRKLRHRLETFHGHRDAKAVPEAWPHLSSEDRFIRNAARVAIEFQPVSEWINRLKAETNPQAVITGTVALARAGSAQHLNDALTLLEKLNFNNLDQLKKLGYLRALSLSFMRLGKPDHATGQKIADRLLQYLPDEDESVNVELVRVLIYLNESRVITKALELIQHSKPATVPDWGTTVKRNNSYGGTIQRMLQNPPPVNKLEYLFMLRDLKSGWTTEQRKTYFSMIADAADNMGGESYWGFLERMRDEALAGVSEEERIALGDIISKPIAKAPPFKINPVKGPGKNWTVDEALQAVNTSSGIKNFEQGRNAFFAIGCASCHQFDGMGGNIGPDLGAVGNRFSVQKILEDIIDPSSTISDLYGSSRVTLNSGRKLEGLVVKEESFIKVYSRDPNKAPDIVANAEVASVEPVPVSQMPAGLINTLNADELRSLIAYLQSGGDPRHPVFKQ